MTKLSLDYIVNAAIHDMENGKAKPHCGDSRGRADEIDYANGYAEPGYSDPDKCILFANWNEYPTRLADILERAGYAIEWSDEWSTCEDCGRAIRTSPDSYGWQASYVILNECEIVCNDCVDWQEYCDSLADNPRKAVPSRVNPADYGYERLSDAGAFENGFHPGQTDDPAKILNTLHAQGKTGILFRISGVGQFDVSFETWIRKED